MIIRKKNKYYLEIFTPEYKTVYLGKIVEMQGIKTFMTHLKDPDTHYFFKESTYPVNEALIKELIKINIRVIAIPEDTGNNVNIYLAKTKELLYGALIHEPNTERQRCIPLDAMTKITKDKYVFQHEYGE